MAGVGVTVSYTPNGVTRRAFDKVLAAYPAPGKVISEKWLIFLAIKKTFQLTNLTQVPNYIYTLLTYFLYICDKIMKISIPLQLICSSSDSSHLDFNFQIGKPDNSHKTGWFMYH